ncbi:tRNA (adenosine(37)-N6)-threonylcarbamoyltransferase complex ATPase subunit type 1 TsaE [Robbsia sp. Bb-Pol-6]|uniref:tRNA threonylcarbamoyladenosine biosynthesis protein TsaE n=1 Tax=Robbsia betulipollinis TaxID=2981849 RepID=A0ABT3ZQH7_9BURK|nr:tRNA (adenosine(37)-N6)-threonylcarbamoyltransferase complex ATPase subunit type 1 TsaE [Robbsia betulipollinis]MCY0388814.1 tRNA (adenosine(37)-N6)-threonylcarbamoyltransferase complex ATPase subunit type 1 TsaE [Robbsia betulipollinis]
MPASPLDEYRYDLPDAAATDALAARFARAVAARRDAAPSPAGDPRRGGLRVHLSGDLGAGKTAFVRATLRALGHAGRVRSPTYTLVEPYALPLAHGTLHVHHFDLYRFSDPAEWHEAGFDEYIDRDALHLIEWPERADGVLGTPDVLLTLEIVGEARVLHAQAFTDAGRTCLHAVAC